MLRLCVFCGSSFGRDPAFARAARELAEALCARGYGLVYGGAKRGLMGVLADAMLERGGEVVGVIPRFMIDRELAHPSLTQLIIVDSMHERKAAMAQHAAAFAALPGGFGTLDELMEIITWQQLGLHAKPIALLNTAGYFDGLLQFTEHMDASGFISAQYRPSLIVASTATELVQRVAPA